MVLILQYSYIERIMYTLKKQSFKKAQNELSVISNNITNINTNGYKRTHDQLYLKESNLDVKQIFVEVADAIEFSKFKSIADVGCATGAFPLYLSKRFPNTQITGIEYINSLIKKAKSDFPHITFLKGNVLDKASIKKKFDVITMLGVLCIFDDYERVLNNVLAWIKPKGRLILQNMVSEYDIDVFIKYSSSSKKFVSNKQESGWNIISEKSLELVVKDNGAKVLSSKPFLLNVNLNKQADVMRSWTEENSLGHNDIFNALHIRQPQKIIVIEKF